MVKLLGGMLIVVSGTLGGMYAGVRLKRQTEFWEQYLLFLTQAQTMIGYGGTAVREIFRQVKGIPLAEPMVREALEALDRGEGIEEAWKRAVQRQMKALGFGSEDIERVYFFGSAFGVTDRQGELAKIQLHTELIGERCRVLKEELAVKLRIYRMVGMCCGVLSAVVVV